MVAALVAACSRPASEAPASSAPVQLATVGAPVPAPSAAPIPDPVSVRAGIVARESQIAALFVGQDSGIFQQHGLKLEIQEVAPSAIPPALQAGELEFTTSGQTASRSAMQGLPLRAVAVILNRPTYPLIADVSIRSVGDLVGKKIVTGPRVSSPGILLTKLLQQQGLQAETDAEVLYIQAPEARSTLLLTRQVDAGIINVDAALRMQRQDHDLRFLVEPAALPPAPWAGIGLAKRLLDEQPEVVERLLTAILEANQYVKSHPAETQAAFSRYLDLTSEESRRVWELVTPAIVPDGLMTDELFEIELQQAQIALNRPELTEADVRAAYDMRITEKVARNLGLLRR
jgi:NitT/TauT family transport system substrate-binding protein